MHPLRQYFLHHRLVSTKNLDFQLEGKVNLLVLLSFNHITKNVPFLFKIQVTLLSNIRHHSSDPSKHESSQIGSKSNTGEGVSIAVKLSDLCDEKLEYFTSASSAREITTEPPSELVFELPNTLKYDCGSPDGDVVPPDTIKTEAVPDSANTLESFDQFLMDDSKGKHHSFEIEKNLRQICSIEQNNETCDWVALVSGAADLLKFDSSIDEEHFEGQNHKSVDPGAISFISTVLQLPQDNANDLETIESVGIISYKQCEMGETASQSREIGKQKETDQMSAILSSTLLDKLVVSNSSDKVDSKEKKCMQPSCKVWHCFDLCCYTGYRSKTYYMYLYCICFLLSN